MAKRRIRCQIYKWKHNYTHAEYPQEAIHNAGCQHPVRDVQECQTVPDQRLDGAELEHQCGTAQLQRRFVLHRNNNMPIV